MKQQTLPVRRRHNPELVCLHQLKAERCEMARQWRRAIHEWSQVIANSGTREEMDHAIQRRNKCSIYCRAPYGTADPRMDYEVSLGDIS